MQLTVSQVANLLNITDRAVRLRIAKGQMQAVRVGGQHGGKSGQIYMIPLSSLPEELRLHYLAEAAKNETSILDEARNRQSSINLAEYVSRYGEHQLRAALDREEVVKQVLAYAGSADYQRALRKAADSFIDRNENGEPKKRGVSPKTIKRWVEAYQAFGFDGLLRKPRADQGQRDSTCPAAADLIRDLYTQPTKPSIMEVHRLATIAAAERSSAESCRECKYTTECPEAEKAGWRVGSYQTTRRIISEIYPADKLYHREGQRAWKHNAMPKILIDRTSAVCNEIWVGDHHVFDFFAVDEHGRIVRPQLTAWQDFRSAAIVGWSISFQGNSRTIGVALYDGIVNSKEVPFCGVPKKVRIDNGKDYRSHYLAGQPNDVPAPHRQEYSVEMRGVFSQLGIDAHYCRPYSPWEKNIERFFGTVADQFSRFQPGWVGRRPEERPEANTTKHLQSLKRRGQLLTLPQLLERFREYLDRYHNTVHSELGDTPLNIWNNTPRFERPQPTKEALLVLLMHQTERKVFPTGIELDTRRYPLTEQLQALVGEKVIVRYDPCHSEEIHVFHQGSYLGLVQSADRVSIHASGEEFADHAKFQKAAEAGIRERKALWKDGSKEKSKEVLPGSTPSEKGPKVVQLTGYERVKTRGDAKEPASRPGVYGEESAVDKLINEHYARYEAGRRAKA